MVDSWVDCAQCANRYDAYFSSCPRCGAANSFSSDRTERWSPPRLSAKRGATGKIVLGIGLATAIAAVVLFAPTIIGFTSTLLGAVKSEGDIPTITVLNPVRQEPKEVPKDQLVRHTLDLINKDRATFGIAPVALSSNQAAQVHAEDVFQNKQISHWMSSGEKPYMTYSRYGGMGGVTQNVAIAGFSKEPYEQCVNNVLYDCEKIDPIATIGELEYEMMYKDKECCDDGHRNNILNVRHTHVSIGIVYDEYYLAVVQNFENNYGLETSLEGSQVRVVGRLLEGTGDIDHVAIYYDPVPNNSHYETNKQMLSYSSGDLVAVVAKPLLPGFYYEQPQDYRLVVADQWTTDGDRDAGTSVDISFDLAKAVAGDGVYTLSTLVKSGEGDEAYEVASYSVIINSESE